MSGVKSRGTIIIAEDDPDISQILEGILEGENFQVILTSDGQSAWDCLEDRAKRLGYAQVHLIISDLMMPRLDGMQFLQRLRNSRFRKIPFLRIIILAVFLFQCPVWFKKCMVLDVEIPILFKDFVSNFKEQKILPEGRYRMFFGSYLKVG